MLWPAPIPPERFGQAPSFELTDQTGNSISNPQFGDKLWIVDFIFTRCPDVCPILSTKMKHLQDKIQQESAPIKLVSITVDPRYDTPSILTEYAAQFGADDSIWKFLTGNDGDIQSTIEGFQQAVERMESDDDVPNILHSQRLVLVDAAGDVRGFYASDAEGLEQLWNDATLLVKLGGD